MRGAKLLLRKTNRQPISLRAKLAVDCLNARDLQRAGCITGKSPPLSREPLHGDTIPREASPIEPFVSCDDQQGEMAPELRSHYWQLVIAAPWPRSARDTVAAA